MKTRNLALAFVIPFATGQVPQINAVLCPMHTPIILCGYICGSRYGLVDDSLPGLVVQLLLIPTVIMIVKNKKLMNN